MKLFNQLLVVSAMALGPAAILAAPPAGAAADNEPVRAVYHVNDHRGDVLNVR